MKNLGVWFDDFFCWNVHVLKTGGNVRFSLRRLWMIAWTLLVETKLRLQRALVFPQIVYCLTITISGYMYHPLSSKLESAFKAFIHFIYGLKPFKSTSRYTKMTLETTSILYVEFGISFFETVRNATLLSESMIYMN